MKLWLLTLPVLYIIGSIPFSYIFVKLVSGKDLRKIGSGNVGATNAFRAAGPLWGVISMILDAAKGAVPLYLLRIFPVLLPPFPAKEAAFILCGVILIMGHVFSVFLKFKGGKGVATTLGVMIVLFPFQILIAFLVFALVLVIFHIVSLASIISALAVLTQAFLFSMTIWEKLFLILIAVFIIVKHRANIVRLVKREEKKLF